MNEILQAIIEDENQEEIEKEEKKVYYFAHPYSRFINDLDDLITEEANIMNCIDQVNYLLDKGYCVYPPIIWTHQVHKFYDKPYDFWWKYNIPMMNKCDGAIFGFDWKKSSGCIKEKEYFEKKNKEILYLDDIIEIDDDF